VFAPGGLMKIVWTPVWVSVTGPRVKLAAEEVVLANVFPSGFRRLTTTHAPGMQLMALPVICTVTCWPVLPLKVNCAFWPGTDRFRLIADPPTIIGWVIGVES